MSRRQFLRNAALLGMSLTAAQSMITGCAPATPAAAPSTAVPPTAASEPTATPAVSKSGGLLRYAYTHEPDDLDPYPRLLWDWPISPQIFSTLTLQDQGMNPQPELAESWEVAPDLTWIEFKLRQDVVFHNGKEFTSRDVKFSAERAANPETGGQLAKLLNGLTVEDKDDYTVRLSLPAPLPAFFDVLDLMWIVDEDTIDQIKDRPNATGPFKVEEWSPNKVLKLVRHEGYWKPGRPIVDEIEMRGLADEATLVLNLEAGELDIVDRVPNQEHERLSGDPNLQLLVSPNHGLMADTLFNTENPPFDNKMVRQAFSHAMDRERYVEKVLFGAGMPKSSPWPPYSWAYFEDLDNVYQFDLDKAKSMLEEANFPFDLEVEYMACTSLFPDLTQFAQLLQADLAKIGVTMKVVDVESAYWTDQVIEGKWTHLAAQYFGFLAKEPSQLFVAFPWQPVTGATNFRNDRYEELVPQCQSEPDREKRKAMLREITEIYIDEQFLACLSPSLRSWGLAANVQGFRTSPDDMVYLEDVALT
jgi:peptide/nickel transport system substrate-binding protein